jgi:hypothetical protein
MAMFRRSPKPPPPLRRRQQEIERQEAELRKQLEKLERMVTQAPSIARRRSRAPASADASKRTQTAARFRVSTERQEKPARRPRSLRKERREGQIICLFLLTALAAAVVWLISHLHS